ncbi:MAG: hypothetical protein EBY57_00575 [Actinobacteria bacterium]|nr:hypothetical protein [Actinomycetota bacterium]
MRPFAWVLLAGVVFAGCGASSQSDGHPVVFAASSLVDVLSELSAAEATPFSDVTGNPLLLADLGDLSRGDVLVALAAPGVPLGEYSREMLSAANIEVTPVTFEADARGVLAKVALGEVDAGIVYATDAASASNVDSVVIPEAEAVNVEYVALDLTGGSGAGQDLIEFLTSDAGRSALANQGFLLP